MAAAAATQAHDDHGAPAAMGTSGWVAPELLEAEGGAGAATPTAASDVFALGVLIWDAVAGPEANNPATGLAPAEAAAQLRAGTRPALPAALRGAAALEALLADCWATDAARRPSADLACDRLGGLVVELMDSRSPAEVYGPDSPVKPLSWHERSFN